MPRPKKSPEETRTRRVSPAFTDAEHRVLSQEAERAGLSLHGFGRRAMLGQKVIVHEGDAALFELIREVRKIGVNINQMAHKANMLDQLPARSYLEEQMDKLDEFLERVMR